MLDHALPSDIKCHVSHARTYLKIWPTRCVTGQTIRGCSAMALWHGEAASPRTDGPLNKRNNLSPPPARHSRRATCAGTAACQLPPKGLASREVHPDAIRSTTTCASLPGSHPEAG